MGDVRESLTVFNGTWTEGRDRQTPIQPTTPGKLTGWVGVSLLAVLLLVITLIVALVILPGLEARDRSLKEREEELSYMLDREAVTRNRLERSMKALNKQQAEMIVNQERLRRLLEENLKLAQKHNESQRKD